MSLIIADTSCLIALERIGRLALLHAVFPEVAAPAAVAEEFGRALPWLRVRDVADRRLVRSLRTQLDKGEAEVLALALEHEGCVVLMDEKKGRRVARRLGVDVIGTVGLLLRAKRSGVVPAVRPFMDALATADFRISEALYREALRRAGE